MSDHDTKETSEDAAFDRELAELLSHPNDQDVAELSRAVLSQIATVNRTQSDAHLSDVLSEPLPWALGFGGLMGLGVVLGYVLSSGVMGDGFIAWLAFGDVISAVGGF